MVGTYGLILLSVFLSASAQILMKLGMSSNDVQHAMAQSGSVLQMASAIGTQPYIVAGLTAFGLSAVSWLLVLSKVDVSQAYPAVALGIVITAAGGYFLLGEAINPTRAAGIVLIISGVVAVAVS